MASIVRVPKLVDSNEAGAWVKPGGGAVVAAELGDVNDGTGAAANAASGDEREIMFVFQPIVEPVKINSALLTVRWQAANPGEAGSGKIHAEVPGFSRQSSGALPFGDALENDTFDVTNLVGIGQSSFALAKFGFENGLHGVGYNDTFVSEFNITLDVTYSVGFLALGVAQWLGPLVAVGLYEMPRLARHLARVSGIRLHRDELELAWRELRAPRRAFA